MQVERTTRSEGKRLSVSTTTTSQCNKEAFVSTTAVAGSSSSYLTENLLGFGGAMSSSSNAAAMASFVGTTSSFIAPTPDTILFSTSESIVSSLASSPLLIGSLWFLSSSIFTTYTTMRFLRYNTGSKAKKKRTLMKTAMTSGRRLQATSVYIPSRLVGGGVQAAENQPTSLIHNTYQRIRQFHQSTLGQLPASNLLTMYRFGGSLLLGLLFFQNTLRSPITALLWDRWNLTMKYATRDFFLPAIFLFLANFLNTIALGRIGISLTYTSKCGIPLITVLLTILLDGWNALPSIGALLSLLPIAAGIAAASWNAPTFELIGFLAALGSTASQSALNVCSKRIISKTGIGGITAQRSMAAVGLVLSVVFNAVHLFLQRKQNESNMSQSRTPKSKSYTAKQDAELTVHRPILISVFAVLAYHIEYVLSFMFVTLVHPISYGTCDAIRRLSIILVGRTMFGGAPLTKVNILGIALALLGALSYSIVS